MKKGLFGFIMMLAAAFVALYFGGWQLALGGTADLINFVIKGQLVDQITLIWPLAKIASAGVVVALSTLFAASGGWLIFISLQDALSD